MFAKANENTAPIHIRYARELTETLVPILEKDFNLQCCGDGGSMPYNISEISLRFEAERRATIQEARELQVKCIQCLLDAINKNEKIRPYLAEYPFPPERIDLSISFDTFYGGYADNTIASVSQARKNFFYDIYDPIKEKYVELFVEPYSEALKIVQNSPLPGSALRYHAKKPYEDALDQLFVSFVHDAGNKWDVICTKPGGNMSDGIKEFAFSFVKYKRTSLEDARKMVVGLTEMLMNKINSDEKLRPYLATYPFQRDFTRIRIQFQKSDSEYFRDGSLHSVRHEKNTITYDKKDTFKEDGPTYLNPILVKEESYDAALQLLHPPKKW